MYNYRHNTSILVCPPQKTLRCKSFSHTAVLSTTGIIISILREIKYNLRSTTLSNTTFKSHKVFPYKETSRVFKEIYL